MPDLKYRDPSTGTWRSVEMVGVKGPPGPAGADGADGLPGGTGMPVPDADIRYVTTSGDTMAGDVSMGRTARAVGGASGFKVINVAPGTAPSDAATVGQIDMAPAVPLATVAGTAPAGGTGDLWVDPSKSALSWDTNWQVPTLLNGWTNYLDTFARAGYRKLPDGRVIIRGLLRATNAASQQLLFTLPQGYGLPSDQNIIFNTYGGTDVACLVRIDVRGYSVTLDGWSDKGHGNNVLTHASLDGIIFWPGA